MLFVEGRHFLERRPGEKNPQSGGEKNMSPSPEKKGKPARWLELGVNFFSSRERMGEAVEGNSERKGQSFTSKRVFIRVAGKKTWSNIPATE